ncbi:phage baseplate assembly protein V [uncultured Veillonella sp.]|uniref:phage baseplate assembly protein V n=1 Tax=uncultured Veillonella sp. TaxID=159268 RepID=UPI0025941190|nr:phage baseplate assembly protein V [uncultured Veillonella sp.]
MVIPKNMLVKGYVVEYYPSTHTLRARIPDKDDKVTAPLQIIEKNSLNTKHQHPYDTGEQVWILFDPSSSNLNEGIVLGAVYSEVDTPPTSSKTVEIVVFSDGTVVSMDTSSSTLTVNCPGTVNIHGATVNISGDAVNINASTLGIHGQNTTFGSGGSSLHMQGTGDVVVNGISLVSHVHGGVQSGGSSTSGPK